MTTDKDLLRGFDNWEDCARYWYSQVGESRAAHILVLKKAQGLESIKDLQGQFISRLEKAETDIDDLRKESATFQARKDTLEEWLTELRDNLKQGNTIDNDQMVSEINDLLNWPE
jgi:hypothetical protein